MGLDMFLYKEVYIGSQYEHRKINIEEINLTAKNVKKKLSCKNLESIRYSVGYWRKANHIHKWFVDNVQDGKDDCKYYPFDKEKLLELKIVCEKVLAIRDEIIAANKPKEPDETNYKYNERILKDVSKGKMEELKKLLPTVEGFFFGGTEYNQYYFSDVEDTINIINECTEEEEDSDLWTSYVYCSSW